jgi:hypothetical protein
MLRIAERPPHPDLLPASGEKERAYDRERCEASVRVTTLAHLAPVQGSESGLTNDVDRDGNTSCQL